jgi:hypothetical protein
LEKKRAGFSKEGLKIYEFRTGFKQSKIFFVWSRREGLHLHLLIGFSRSTLSYTGILYNIYIIKSQNVNLFFKYSHFRYRRQKTPSINLFDAI